MRASDKIREYLTKYPDALTSEVAAAIGLPAGQTGNALRGMRANGTTVSRKDESARVRGGHTPTRWRLAATATTAKPGKTPRPKAASAVANNEQERAFEAKLNHWKGRAETAEADAHRLRTCLEAIEAVFALRTGWTGPFEGLADAVRGVYAERDTTIDAWDDALSGIIVAEAEAYAPEGSMSTAETVRHTLRALKSRIAASEAREKELLDAAPAAPTIDGIPYDAAIRQIAYVAGVDVFREGEKPGGLFLADVLAQVAEQRAVFEGRMATVPA